MTPGNKNHLQNEAEALRLFDTEDPTRNRLPRRLVLLGLDDGQSANVVHVPSQNRPLFGEFENITYILISFFILAG